MSMPQLPPIILLLLFVTECHVDAVEKDWLLKVDTSFNQAQVALPMPFAEAVQFLSGESRERETSERVEQCILSFRTGTPDESSQLLHVGFNSKLQSKGTETRLSSDYGSGPGAVAVRYASPPYEGSAQISTGAADCERISAGVRVSRRAGGRGPTYARIGFVVRRRAYAQGSSASAS